MGKCRQRFTDCLAPDVMGRAQRLFTAKLVYRSSWPGRLIGIRRIKSGIDPSHCHEDRLVARLPNQICHGTRLICGVQLLFCGGTGLFCRKSNLFCRRQALFCRRQAMDAAEQFCFGADHCCFAPEQFCFGADNCCFAAEKTCSGADHCCSAAEQVCEPILDAQRSQDVVAPQQHSPDPIRDCPALFAGLHPGRLLHPGVLRRALCYVDPDQATRQIATPQPINASRTHGQRSSARQAESM
jgi:hypothetical protein